MSVLSEVIAGVNPATTVDDIAKLGQSIIDRVWPDKIAQAKERDAAAAHVADLAAAAAAARAAQLAQGDTQQVELDTEEAKSESLFKSGWRPAIGWVGAAALFVYYVPYCIVATVLWAGQVYHTGALVSRPDLGISDLIGLIASMLGLASLRTMEKKAGVA